jgi:diguanylate cyclase (GGDEF)-like protein
MYFVTQYVIDKGPFLQISISSAILFAVGIIVALSQRLTTKNNIFDILVIGIAIVAIPTVTISFITYAGLTVWAFPFIFVLISMLFNNRRLLIASSIVIALTQTLIWILKPTVDVNINASDYLVRFGIFGISIWIAFYVNKTYIRRLKENAEKNMHQKLVSDISSLLLSLRDYNKEEKIHCLLEEIADRFSTGTVFLYLADPSVKGSFDVTVLSSGAVRKSLTTSEDANRTLIEMLCTNPVNDTLGPVNSSHWKLFLSENNLQSVVSQPIIQDGVGMGFIGMASDKPVSWSEDQVSTLSVLSNILADSASRLAAENEIEFMAYHDHLTRLPNRLLFSDRTEQAISLASRNATMIGVIFLDLDSFKNVNDTFGHRFGDELIREVSEKLVTRVRKSDTVSRFGGDEFLIMLNNMGSRHDIIQVTDSIMQLFDNPVHLNGQELYITASAGIAVYPLDGETTDVLIKNADIAMYNAKDKGMNQYMFCSEDMKEDILYKAQLTNHLYHVLDRSELKVYFQPQVSLQTKQIVGAEALLRWFHPEFGLVSPGTFIPLAEKSGVINKIGEWVLRETCRQARLWHDMGLPPIRMAVNISANQLRNPRFAELVEQILAEYQLAPEYLELEVTESVAIREPAYIVALLNQLKNIGVQLSIDDFGTEYSSLSRLKQLPADRIKIDMQFVQGIDKSEKDRAISKVIINLAKSLHIKVIAEGVENKEQLSYLDEKLCDEVQGFFYYKPMPPVELEMILIRMKESELSAG